MKTSELFELKSNPVKPRREQVKIYVAPNTKGAAEEVKYGGGTMIKTGKWIKWVWQKRKGDDGKDVMGKTYYDPGFRKRRTGYGDILGTVGEWLKEMGATREDLAPAIEKVRASHEYKHLLSLGVRDESTPAELKNGTLRFAAEHEGIIGSSEEKKPIFLRKVLANGNIRTYAGSGDEHHAGRGRTTHPATIKTEPHLTPVERIVKSMRASIELVAKTFQMQSKKHFIRSMKD